MRRGFRLLGYSTEAVPEFVYTVTAARRSWAYIKEDKVCVLCARACGGIQNSSVTRPIVPRSIRTISDTTSFPRATAELTYSLYLEPDRKVLPMRGEINRKGMARAIEYLGEAEI